MKIHHAQVPARAAAGGQGRRARAAAPRWRARCLQPAGGHCIANSAGGSQRLRRALPPCSPPQQTEVPEPELPDLPPLGGCASSPGSLIMSAHGCKRVRARRRSRRALLPASAAPCPACSQPVHHLACSHLASPCLPPDLSFFPPGTAKTQRRAAWRPRVPPRRRARRPRCAKLHACPNRAHRQDALQLPTAAGSRLRCAEHQPSCLPPPQGAVGAAADAARGTFSDTAEAAAGAASRAASSVQAGLEAAVESGAVLFWRCRELAWRQGCMRRTQPLAAARVLAAGKRTTLPRRPPFPPAKRGEAPASSGAAKPGALKWK